MESNDLITAWVAGLFEGEGTIVIVKSRVTTCIQMTDLDVLQRCQMYFGGKIYDTRKQAEHHKQSWKWSITSTAEAIAFLELIYPLLGGRRRAKVEQAREAFKTHKSNKINQYAEEVFRLRGQGLKHREIADILGIDRSYVSHILRKRSQIKLGRFGGVDSDSQVV